MSNPHTNSNDDNEFRWLEVDFSDVSYLIKKHLKLLFWAPAIGFLLAFVAAKVQRPVFATEVEIYLRPNFDQEIQVEQSNTKMEDDDSLRSIERSMISDTVILAMVEKLDLRNEADFLGEKIEPEKLTDAKVLKTIRDRYDTKLVATTRNVKLRVEDFSAKRTALIADTLIGEFLGHLQKDRNLKEADLREMLVAQSQIALTGALELEKKLNQFRAANPETLADQDSSIFRDRVVQSGNALNDANAQRSILAGTLKTLETIDPVTEPVRVFQMLSNRNSEHLSDLLTMHATAKSEFGVIKKQYQPAHPRYFTAKNRLTEAEDTLRDYAIEMKKSVQAEYDAATGKVAELSETLSNLRGEMVGQKSVSAEFRGMKEEIDRNWNTYSSLQQKIMDLDLNPEVKPTFATVMSGPVVPDKKAKPRTLFYVAGGTFLGGILALGLIFWKNRNGLPFTSQSQMGKILALPTVAALQTRLELGSTSQLAMIEQSQQMVNLLVSLRDTRLVHVTSIESENAGGLLSTALSRGSARQGSRVLLVPFQYHIQRPAEIQNDPSTPGLSVLNLPTDILAAGNEFYEGITKLFESYDRIIVDTSRISENGVRLAVGRFAQANLLEVRPDSGPERSAYRRCLDEFESAGIHSVGLVSIENSPPESKRTKKQQAPRQIPMSSPNPIRG